MTILIDVLNKALCVNRAAYSKNENEFVAYLASNFKPSMIDGAGNLHFDNRKTPANRTLITCHSDTVTNEDLPQRLTKSDDIWSGAPNTLGADDGAGVALLMQMLADDVPVYGIVFRGEEQGGIGSRWLAEYNENLLYEFDRAIALDRAGQCDVITHQGGLQCCSDEFAVALAEQLNVTGLMYQSDSTGVYTDTAEFVDYIPECSNISVGYEHCHTQYEKLDVAFLRKLSSVLKLVQWDSLPDVREIGSSFLYDLSDVAAATFRVDDTYEYKEFK